jgi:hypothetical protein
MMRIASRHSLWRFQDAFARALLHDPPRSEPAMSRLASQPAFAVYRNTVMKGCIDALQANFPSVARLVGEEWFREAARVYATLLLPREPSLLAYGASFPVFLRAFPPAKELPYLADVAQLDRFWTEAHAAADAPPLAPATFGLLDAQRLGEAVLHPHPAARWAWFADVPAYTIWRRNRETDADEGEIAWRAEGALLTRPADAVGWQPLGAAGCRFLDACARGQPVAQALEAAHEAETGADLAGLVSGLVNSGALARLTFNAESTS